MAMIAGPNGVAQLVFGFDSAKAACKTLNSELLLTASRGDGDSKLMARLQAYAKGRRDDFRDVVCDLGPLSGFRRRVIDACRAVGYGKTLTYAQLAAKAGSPGAARAVGNCMAANRVPLIIPCHRIVAGVGGLGGYSGGQGLETKRLLIKMESAPSNANQCRKPLSKRHGSR